MQHVDEGLLHAWLDGERAALGPARAEEVRRHLDGCAECRTRLGEARELRDRADALLRGGGPVGVEVPPFESLAGRVPARRSRTRMLAWAASLVLALGAGWLARGAPDPGEPSARTAAAPRRAPSPAVPMPPAATAPAGTTGVVPAPLADAAPARKAGPRALPQVAARPDAPAPVAADVTALEAMPVPPPPPPVAAADAAPPPIAVTQAAPPAAAPAASGEAASSRRRAERVAARVPSAPGADSADLPAPNFGGTLALEGLVVTGTPTLEEVLAGAVGPDADGWFSVRPEVARRLLGREPLRVRGLPLISVQAGRWEGRAAVRVRQRLEGGGLLSLVQVPDRARERGESGDSAVVPDAWDEAPTAHVRMVRQVGTIVVTGSAPLPADSLARLLERLR